MVLNAEQYKAKSDQEIANELCGLLGYEILKDGKGYGYEVVKDQSMPSREYFNPINSGDDTLPLIIEHDVSVINDDAGNVGAVIGNGEQVWLPKEKYLRAAVTAILIKLNG